MMNNISISGRLVAEPELKYTKTDMPYTRITIAVNRGFKDKNGHYPVDFIDAEALKATAKFICSHFEKGQFIEIKGELRTNSYTDKDGIRRKYCSVFIDKAEFCGDRKKKTTQTPPAEQAPLPDESQMPSYEQTGMDGCDYYEPNTEDDLPF